jgi:hypothetical protein
MLTAAVIFAVAVLLGALLNVVVPQPRQRGKDIYINGRRVELVALMERMRVQMPTRWAVPPKRLVVRKLPNGTRVAVEQPENPWRVVLDEEYAVQFLFAQALDGVVRRGKK